MIRPRTRTNVASATAIVTLLVLMSACRDASDTTTTAEQPIVPSPFGSNGCSAPDVVFTAGSTPTPIVLTTLVTTSDSQICATRGSELLYATGSNGQIVAIDVSGPVASEIELVMPGRVATLLAGAGIVQPPRLSGIAVLDRSTLLVIERTSNTILAVARTSTDSVGFYAGQPNLVPGFASGLAEGQQGVARFNFDQPSMLAPSGDGRVFVADPGNHAIRVVSAGMVFTAAGLGTSGFNDGSLSSALFDTPTGITIACNQTLVVSECGANGFGNRLRGIQLGATNPFLGGLQGSVFTVLGDGTPATTGGPVAGAQVDGPTSPFVSTGGELYWIDAASGVLRRARADGTVDCPLASSCASAVGAPTFAPGHLYSMAVTDSGTVFVLDASAGQLLRVAP
jgi:hypothetical protein